MNLREESFGIVPLRHNEGVWYVFLILHRGGRHWAFPKGRGIAGETPIESAMRELFEETGLEVERFLREEPFQEQYMFRRKGQSIEKRVHYFPALVKGTPRLQPEEIQDGRWVLLKEAVRHLTFTEAKEICRILAQQFNL